MFSRGVDDLGFQVNVPLNPNVKVKSLQKYNRSYYHSSFKFQLCIFHGLNGFETLSIMFGRNIHLP